MRRQAPRQGFLVRWLAPLIVGATLSAGTVLYLWQGVEQDGPVEARPTIMDFGGTPLVTSGRPAIAPATHAPSATPASTGQGAAAPAAPPGLPPSPPPTNFEAVFPRVTVLDSARFKVLKADTPLTVHLGGVTGLAFSQGCDGPASRWNCGARARADLARLIGPRSVGCINVKISEDDGESRADCWVGQRNLSVYMVSRGWAEPIDPADKLLAPYAEKAKAEKRGQYGDGSLTNTPDDAE